MTQTLYAHMNKRKKIMFPEIITHTHVHEDTHTVSTITLFEVPVGY
jgi:amino acid transporter